jgi:DNA-3-methyladenine glycosylase II
MLEHVVVPVDGPFSLAAAASFGFGPNNGRPDPGDDCLRMAFGGDDLKNYVGAVVRQEAEGVLTMDITDGCDVTMTVCQISRIVSIDTSVDGWLAAGQADPVLGGLQAAHPGMRPVLFHSPYEAAAWSVLSQRRHRAQAMKLHQRMSEAAGRTFDLAGQFVAAFPLPSDLLQIEEFPAVEPERMARLHGVARAAIEGQFDVPTLRSMAADAAMASLRRIKGLGPVYSMLVYLRSVGVTDGLAVGEPRLAGYLRHYYGLAETPDAATMERLAEPWRPFRTWAGVLFRLVGDAEGLPFEEPAGERRPVEAVAPAAE